MSSEAGVDVKRVEEKSRGKRPTQRDKSGVECLLSRVCHSKEREEAFAYNSNEYSTSTKEEKKEPT